MQDWSTEITFEVVRSLIAQVHIKMAIDRSNFIRLQGHDENHENGSNNTQKNNLMQYTPEKATCSCI